MSSLSDHQKNAARFTGFADTYDRARPAVPDYPVNIIRRYLGHTPDTVVDLGCGTGLSTRIWKGRCRRVIGIDPSGDMLAAARGKEGEGLSFRQGCGSDTGLPDACADAVVCSQSFHWMEPGPTLREIDRILKPGGVFAAIDYDWPPVAGWRAEREYEKIYGKIREWEERLPDVNASFIRYRKDRHLTHIRDSGYFRYARELVFAHTESCTAQRFIDMIYSQGSTQAVLKRHPEVLEEDLERFQKAVREIWGDAVFEVDFCYRMRLAVK